MKASTPFATAQATARASTSDATTRAPGRRAASVAAIAPAAGAEVDRRAVARQALGGAARERLALPARDVDAGIDADLQAAEHDGRR